LNNNTPTSYSQSSPEEKNYCLSGMSAALAEKREHQRGGRKEDTKNPENFRVVV